MPGLTVNREALWAALGQKYEHETFDELCFEYGLEIDETTEDSYKLDIGANRVDLLCLEGLALALGVFIGKKTVPAFKALPPSNGKMLEVTVHQETEAVRPYFSAAVLRGVKLDAARYESFIALQDKLHQNLARQRTLVAIGTHDLSTIQGPFTYEALPPQEIEFAPLNQTKSMKGNEMMEFYEKDLHLRRYLPIIRDKPRYPIIYDANRTVLSMPPIINSNHSKITLDTRDIFIDITATDKTKLEVVNHIICAMFSQYCTEPFTVEQVKVISPHNNQTRITPDLSPRQTTASASFINSVCGLKLSRDELCGKLARMSYSAQPSKTSDDLLDVAIPVTRPDVFHQADIMEDVAVAYGFNNLPRHFPSTSSSVAAALPINKLADIIRLESAMAGWSEVMPLILCSHDENYAWLNKKDDGKAVRLQNPKTAEYQIVRTSLIPGLLKTVRENRRHAVPMRIFEVSDVGFKDASLERRSRNERHFAACFYGKTSGFEQVHGLLDRVMLMLRSAFITREDGLSKPKLQGYFIEGVKDSTFLQGHAAAIYLQLAGQQPLRIGTFGILHPAVLKHFELPYPASTLELNLEVFL